MFLILFFTSYLALTEPSTNVGRVPCAANAMAPNCANTLRRANTTAPSEQERRHFTPRNHNLLMSLRQNAPHFWYWAKANGQQHLTPETLKITGYVTGDPHHENFGDVKTEQGASFGLIDVDDGGQAPLLIDMVRFLTTVKAMPENFTNSTTKKLVDVYLKALTQTQNRQSNYQTQFPDEFNFTAELFKYGKKKSTRERKLDHEELELDDLPQPEKYTTLLNKTKEALKNLWPQAKILDVGSRMKTVGGSRGLLRIWILVEAPNNELAIFELKELTAPATAQLHEQKSHLTRLEKITSLYWPHLSPYYRTLVSGSQNFWLRPKMKNLIDHEDMNEAEVINLLKDIAQYLGEKQNGQISATERRQLKTNSAELKKQIEDMAEAYLELVRPLARENQN